MFVGELLPLAYFCNDKLSAWPAMGETRYIHKPTFPQERRQVHEFNVTCILYRRTGREGKEGRLQPHQFRLLKIFRQSLKFVKTLFVVSTLSVICSHQMQDFSPKMPLLNLHLSTTDHQGRGLHCFLQKNPAPLIRRSALRAPTLVLFWAKLPSP